MKKPNNTYRKGSRIWALMEEDWSDLTIKQIAEVFDACERDIRTTMNRIKRETGYIVPYKREKVESKH